MVTNGVEPFQQEQMNNPCQVIVIGAGIAGLVAAYELQKAGRDVIVLESSSQSGGRMVTEKYNNCIVDTGAQFLSSGYPLIANLIKELNLESEFVPTSPYCSIIKNGRIHTFRYNSPLSLLWSGLLGFGEWLRLGINGKKLYNATKKLDASNYSVWNEFDHQDAYEWSRRCYGINVADYFTEPMLEAFYFQQAQETSQALPIALNAFGFNKSKIMTLAGGIAKLPAKLSEKVHIYYNSPVDKIVVSTESVTIRTSKQEYKAEKVVLATPAPIAAKMFCQANELEKNVLATPYSATLNITLGLKNSLPGRQLAKTYGLWIPAIERKNIAAIAIESNKNNDRVTTGDLLNIMLSGRTGKKMMHAKEEEIVHVIGEELETYYPNISEDIFFSKITRWPYAEPLSPIGRSKNLHMYRERTTGASRVLLAGDYMGMPFTEGAAETGRWAAAQILLSE